MDVIDVGIDHSHRHESRGLVGNVYENCWASPAKRSEVPFRLPAELTLATQVQSARISSDLKAELYRAETQLLSSDGLGRDRKVA
jgi:hypothetical protein